MVAACCSECIIPASLGGRLTLRVCCFAGGCRCNCGWWGGKRFVFVLLLPNEGDLIIVICELSKPRVKRGAKWYLLLFPTDTCQGLTVFIGDGPLSGFEIGAGIQS